jgi:hypothetical protein
LRVAFTDEWRKWAAGRFVDLYWDEVPSYVLFQFSDVACAGLTSVCSCEVVHLLTMPSSQSHCILEFETEAERAHVRKTLLLAWVMFNQA